MTEAERGGEGTGYKSIGAGSFYRTWVDRALLEMTELGQDSTGRYHCPNLAALWAITKPLAEEQSREALRLRDEWDAVPGDPAARGWELPWPEMATRIGIIASFLVRIGLLSPQEHKADESRTLWSEAALDYE